MAKIVRMIATGSRFFNIQEELVAIWMSAAFYSHRGGSSYLKDMVTFRLFMRESGFINVREYAMSVVPHAVVCLMPNRMRDLAYRKLLRK